MTATTQFVMIRRSSKAVAEYDGVEHDDEFIPGAESDGFTYGSCARSALSTYEEWGWEEVTDLQLIDDETGQAVGGAVLSPTDARAKLAEDAKAAEMSRLGLRKADDQEARQKAADKVNSDLQTAADKERKAAEQAAAKAEKAADK